MLNIEKFDRRNIISFTC